MIAVTSYSVLHLVVQIKYILVVAYTYVKVSLEFCYCVPAECQEMQAFIAESCISLNEKDVNRFKWEVHFTHGNKQK